MSSVLRFVSPLFVFNNCFLPTWSLHDSEYFTITLQIGNPRILFSFEATSFRFLVTSLMRVTAWSRHVEYIEPVQKKRSVSGGLAQRRERAGLLAGYRRNVWTRINRIKENKAYLRSFCDFFPDVQANIILSLATLELIFPSKSTYMPHFSNNLPDVSQIHHLKV